MKTSAIAGQDINRIIILLLVIGTFFLVAGALYIGIHILPAKSLSAVVSITCYDSADGYSCMATETNCAVGYYLGVLFT